MILPIIPPFPKHLTCIRLLFCALVLLQGGCAVDRGRKVTEPVSQGAPTGSIEFRQATGALLGQGFVTGNDIKTLVNGDAIFPAMLAAIRSAQKSINFETYVFWDGDIAKKMAAALAERARCGVKVHVILDAQGTHKMGMANVSMMREAGVEIEKYHTAFWWDVRRYNNRTHRKLLIVDGKVGFIGGVGIADEWEGNAEAPEHWRDNHYRVTGPVVAEMQGLFMDNWLKTRGTVLNGSDYFPALPPSGPYVAQAFKSSPQYGENGVSLMYLLALASATHTVLIENAYFVPDDLTRRALIQAAQRGVQVQVLIPGPHIDQKAVTHASRRHWPELLKAGIKIYEYQPTMVHVKLMVVDGIFTSIGSANFDNRSIRLNDEANLNVLSRDFASQHTRLFEIDKTKSKPVSINDKGKLIFDTPMQAVSGLVAPQL